MEKVAVVEVQSCGFSESKEFKFKDDFTVEVHDDIVYFKADEKLQLGVAKELLVSFVVLDQPERID